jgi:hypothetical protein
MWVMYWRYAESMVMTDQVKKSLTSYKSTVYKSITNTHKLLTYCITYRFDIYSSLTIYIYMYVEEVAASATTRQEAAAAPAVAVLVVVQG